MDTVDRGLLQRLLAEESAAFVDRNPVSRSRQAGTTHLFGGVPMTWLAKSATPYPVHFATAHGARIADVDGHELVDFCLGDTGAMAGHSPGPTVAAVQRRYAESGGATTMLLTEAAGEVGTILADRFGLPLWSFALTATDANRWAIRLARAVTGRPKILVNAYSYHGSVDESFAVKGPEGAVFRRGNVGPPCDIALTTRVAEYNDLDDLEGQLAHGDVAAVLMEPAMTNMGIVLPEDGYLAGVRELTRASGTLLINDETHTLSAGPGGCTAAWGLEPDLVTLGKSIGGGIPAAAYGITAEVADRLASRADLDLVDTGGVGGTLAGNALSLEAVRATLTDVLTPAAFAGMTDLATRYTAGIDDAIRRSGLPWTTAQLGARSEYRFTNPAPRNGTESEATTDAELEDFLHLFLLNRGVLLTPFHNMALMCPATTAEDVDLHVELFGQAVAALRG